MYKLLIRPLLFMLDAEKAHSLLISLLRFYGRLPFIRSIVHRCYETTDKPFLWNNLKFKNRIGLSAGFDKGAEVFNELSDFGFSFMEIGTVTPDPQRGNPKPRIFRLPKSESIISRTGFNNPGLYVVRCNLDERTDNYIIGININKNPHSDGQETVNDFFELYSELYHLADYFTLNWGSVDAVMMQQVLSELTAYRLKQSKQSSILLKVPADTSAEEMDEVIRYLEKYNLQGVVATGPTMDRSNLSQYTSEQLEEIGTGGVSGKGIGEKSVKAVRYFREHGNKDMLIIGAGGIMSPEDAQRMIDAGANLVQIYSAFIYEGPSIVRKMIKGVK